MPKPKNWCFVKPMAETAHHVFRAGARAAVGLGTCNMGIAKLCNQSDDQNSYNNAVCTKLLPRLARDIGSESALALRPFFDVAPYVQV